MKTILNSGLHHYVTRLSITLIILALIAGMVGCAPATRYDLTISSTEGGSVTTPGEATSTYDEGEVVDLVANPDAGYLFDEWTGDVGTVADVEDATTTITMNDNYDITANFLLAYDLTIVANPVGGGTATDLANASPYTVGTGVSIKALANSGYHFVNWTAPAGTFDNATAAQTTFTMPAQNVKVTASFAIDLYFRPDAMVVLKGPATLPPEERNPCVTLEIYTNIVVDSVQVDLPDGKSVIIPHFTDVFSPGVDQITVFRFNTCVLGMAIAGGEYIFTGLDAAGEPIPGARNIDIWVGVEPPAPPTNVRAEVTKDGILVSWDESPMVPGSFEPAAEPQLGCYQLWISRVETGERVYGAEHISASPHLIPRDKADFIEWNDLGLSLSEMEDGTYYLGASALSIAPKDSLGKSLEWLNSDSSQDIIFTIEDGEITIE